MSAASSVLGQIRDRLQSIIERRRAVVQETAVSLPDVWREVIEFIGEVAQLVQATGADGPAKRAAVLESVGELYDRVIEPWNIPWVPDSLVDPILREAVIRFADMSIDGIVALLKSRNMLGAAAP